MQSWLRILSWEWLQNAPAIAGLVLGIQARREGDAWLAAGLAAAGGVLSALVIRWTEGRKQGAAPEPYRLTLANALGFAMACIAMSWYLALEQAWLLLVDALLGLVLGFGLSLWQEQAARGSTAFSSTRSAWLHRIAFVASFPGTLILLRLTAGLGPAWAVSSAVPISLIASVVIAAVDYGGAGGAAG